MREISESCINSEELTIRVKLIIEPVVSSYIGGLREDCKDSYGRLVGCIIRLALTFVLRNNVRLGFPGGVIRLGELKAVLTGI
jgi:hypothetical protein